MSRKLGVALVGLGFGGSFAPIYRDHPDVRTVGLYDPDRVKTELFSRATGIEKTYASFEEILRDKEIDAVHLVSPIPEHEAQTLAVLYAGKHCACTVPMATTIEGLRRIVQAVNQAGKVYMMMETSVYTRPFFTARRPFEGGCNWTCAVFTGLSLSGYAWMAAILAGPSPHALRYACPFAAVGVCGCTVFSGALRWGWHDDLQIDKALRQSFSNRKRTVDFC